MKVILNLNELRFSFEEIEIVFDIYHQHFKNPEKLGFNYIEFEQILYAYSGEAFKYYQGGEWSLCTTKNDKAYGTPIIVKWGGEDYPWSRISPKIWKNRLEKFGVNDMKPAKDIFS